MEPLAAAYGLKITTIFGGVSQQRQVAALKAGVDIVVACPGRLEDLMQQKFVSLDAVEITVLDEADHMADLGFLPVVTRIMDKTPGSGQRMLFSATLDNGVDKLVRKYLHNEVLHSVDEVTSHVAAMTHHVFEVDSVESKRLLIEKLASGKGRRILFMRTKHHAKKLAKQLTDAGIPAVDLHGNLSQPQRDRNLAAFSQRPHGSGRQGGRGCHPRTPDAAQGHGGSATQSSHQGHPAASDRLVSRGTRSRGRCRRICEAGAPRCISAARQRGWRSVALRFGPRRFWFVTGRVARRLAGRQRAAQAREPRRRTGRSRHTFRRGRGRHFGRVEELLLHLERFDWVKRIGRSVIGIQHLRRRFGRRSWQQRGRRLTRRRRRRPRAALGRAVRLRACRRRRCALQRLLPAPSIRAARL